ncbi:hypothetical protein SGFS_048660 [Streptomyces graminofaciens]|uniref:Uncharacterized protein n=1 Tax=Streptomyces graminofaciens TaxID=68212 RepID=A0ABN5VN42_9ACTN|nr:hypothetical protein [Streptomyces graminofaciens]BBC33572.1 hypothetical protein SGFS_048660 [Streptomyces graminofaciens]
MTTRRHPPLKSITPTTTTPHAAEPAARETAVGEPKGAARKGARTALRSDPPQGDGRYPVGWLHIVVPRGATPTATSKCLCGWDRSAVGYGRVLALIEAHEAHRDTCPLRTTQEGRAAA